MSQLFVEVIESGNVPKEEIGTGDRLPPLSVQMSEGEPKFSDGSDPIYAMYNETAGEEDRMMTESWKADADRILVFTGLFSAAVAILVAFSIQDLRPNPQDRSMFYLQNIYQLLADPNTPNVSILPTLTDPPPFSPPRHAVWVNSLWFLSLAIGLTCGVLATLLGQWARQYLKIIQTRSSPHKRARIRAFFAKGVDESHLPWVVGALTFLFHLSLSLFFAGLLVLLSNTDHVVFGVVAGWVALCVAIYGYITFIPIFRQNSPYFSPLSSPAWSLLHGTICVTIRTFYAFGVLDCVGRGTRDRMLGLAMRSYRRFVDGVVKTAEQTAVKISSEIDAHAFIWTFDSLNEDHELEQFFAGLPGFCNSKLVSNPFEGFVEPHKGRLSDALVGLMHRTLTSTLVSESVRKRRSLICTRAMHAASLSIRPSICEEIINGGWDGLLNYVEFGHFIKRIRYNDLPMAYHSICMVAVVVSKVKERENLWLELAMDHLGISAYVLQNYLAHGDSVLLANFIHIVRDLIHVHFDQFQSADAASRWKVLESVSQFDIQNTLPSLQYDFCDLWNEIVDMAETTPDHRIRPILISLLKNIRRAYIALHEGTDSAPTAFSASTTDDEHTLFLLSSYPLCNIPSHRPRPVDATARTYLSSPQAIVLPGSSSSYHLETPQTTFGNQELPPIMISSSEFALIGSAQGAADASIMTSTSGSAPITQATRPAPTTFTSRSHTSLSSGTPASANHAQSTLSVNSATQATPSPVLQ